MELIAFSEKLQDNVLVRFGQASASDIHKIENAPQLLDEAGGQVLVIGSLLKYYKETKTWKLGEFLEEIAQEDCAIDIKEE